MSIPLTTGRLSTDVRDCPHTIKGVYNRCITEKTDIAEIATAKCLKSLVTPTRIELVLTP